MTRVLVCNTCLLPSDTIRLGRCVKCYSKHRYDNLPEVRAKQKTNRDNWYKSKKEADPQYFLDRAKRSARRMLNRFSTAKSIAKRRGVAFELSKFHFVSLLLGAVCSYCEGPLPETSVALDRLDNSKGYVRGNVVPCCQECNRLKGSVYTPEETLAMVLALKEFRNG